MEILDGYIMGSPLSSVPVVFLTIELPVHTEGENVFKFLFTVSMQKAVVLLSAVGI
jgi:hypothetical protein